MRRPSSPTGNALKTARRARQAHGCGHSRQDLGLGVAILVVLGARGLLLASLERWQAARRARQARGGGLGPRSRWSWLGGPRRDGCSGRAAAVTARGLLLASRRLEDGAAGSTPSATSARRCRGLGPRSRRSWLGGPRRDGCSGRAAAVDSTIASTKIFKVLKNKLEINTEKL